MKKLNYNFKFDLKYFILRTNALIIYREAIKFTYKVKDPFTQIELQQYIRYEYENNKNVEDRKKIEYMLGLARKKLNDFKDTYLMST
jgi:hypothetical protein